jgi:hypothetical protein
MKTLGNVFYLFCLFCVGFIFTSCQMTTYHTTDPRFPQVFGKEIHTKHTLRLYRLSHDFPSGLEYHYITESYFPFSATDSGEIGVLPVGHAVVFDRLKRVRKTDSVREVLLGRTKFRGTTYPVCFDIGSVGDESVYGWKGVYSSFVVSKP